MMAEAVMNSVQSTRQPPPIYQLKRPMQKLSLDDLLVATDTDLLGSVVATLKNHSQRYNCHLEQQRQLYNTYINTLVKSQIRTSVEKTVTKPCDKLSSCKLPATFIVLSNQITTDRAVDQEAKDLWVKASNAYSTLMVDSRVSAQTMVGASRINSIVCQLLRPGISRKDYATLLTLAWNCLAYLWQHLQHITLYPPVKAFLLESSESLAKVISLETSTMDRLLALFASDDESIVFLYQAFDPNLESPAMFVQRYQQVTRLVIGVMQKEASSGLQMPVAAALEYLIQSFAVTTWINSDTALDETNRQSFYLASCHFIQQLAHLRYKDVDSGNDDGQVADNSKGTDLATLCTSHMMAAMTSFVRKQQGTTQGEHLYVLHLLLDSLLADSNSSMDDTVSTPLTNALDAFTDTLSQQKSRSIIITQQDWKQQHQPSIKLQWALLDDPGHTLDVLLSILSKLSADHSTNVLRMYGSSGCMSLSRLIFALLLDNRIGWNLGLLDRSFELFWTRPHSGTLLNGDDKVGKLSEEPPANPQTTNAQIYITSMFALAVDILLFETIGTATGKSILNDLDHHCHHILLDQMDSTWLALFLPMIDPLPWHHLSPIDTERLNTMLSRCLYLQKHDRRKSATYSTFVVSILDHTAIKDYQYQVAAMDHHSFVLYVKLVFVLLMNADSTWPDPAKRLENLEKLWQPIANTPRQLSATDMENLVATTHIDEPSNWSTALDPANTANSMNDSNTGQDPFVICIRWLRHLTVAAGSTSSIKLISVFGRFILAHLQGIGSVGPQMDWLRVLLDQVNDYMAAGHDSTSDFMDCVDWLKSVVLRLMDQPCSGEGTTAAMDTIGDFIATCEYCTALAMFTVCIPSRSALATSSGTMDAINNRIRVMEQCLERCIQLREDQDVWLRVGTLLQDTFFGQHNDDKTATVEEAVSECIRYSLDLSCFLVLNAYCHLHGYYFLVASHDLGSGNNDHLAAEEIAAILSMAHLDADKMDIKQIRKIMGLVQLFGSLLSKNKERGEMDLWLASIVSLTRSFTRWYAMAAPQALSLSDNSHGWLTWKAITIVLECFLASRLALLGIPPYSGIGQAKDGSNKTNVAHWVALLEQRKKHDSSHKKLFGLAVDAVKDMDRWTLWDLETFFLRLVKPSLV